MDQEDASFPQDGIRVLLLPPRLRFALARLPRLREQEQAGQDRSRMDRGNGIL